MGTQSSQDGKISPTSPRAAGDGTLPVRLHDEDVPRDQRERRHAQSYRSVRGHGESTDCSNQAALRRSEVPGGVRLALPAGPSPLLLDEPTNHLDMETIDALADAINNFDGGVVLVSHDFRLIDQVADTIWICEKETVTKWEGDIISYKDHLKAKVMKEAKKNAKKLGIDTAARGNW